MRKRRRKFKLQSKYILLIAAVLCVAAMLTTATFNISGGPLNYVASVIFSPMQNGLNQIGMWITDRSDEQKSKDDLIAENEALQEKVDDLTTQNNTLVLDAYQLQNLQELYSLDQEYSDYEKVGAYVIAKDSGNWFNTFTINKGSKDGLEVDMNVIAGSGLVGIITKVGPHTATVRSIIDDMSNVSAMVLTTSDCCIVSGNLQTMNASQVISLSQLRDTDEEVQTGTAIVTSYISDKYLPGLLIGYISSLEDDSNNLTKSGTITPAVDFEHLEEVLVILDKKQTDDTSQSTDTSSSDTTTTDSTSTDTTSTDTTSTDTTSTDTNE